MKKNKTIIIFLIKFFVTYFFLSGLYSLYLHETQEKVGVFSCAPITKQVAEHTKVLSELLGLDSHVEQSDDELSMKFFINNQHVSNVVEGCSSISVIILFLSFIIAFSGGFKETFFFAIFGIITIYLVNLFRIFLLGYWYLKNPYSSEVFHDYVFPAIIYGYVFLLWIVWVKHFSNHNQLKNVKSS